MSLTERALNAMHPNNTKQIPDDAYFMVPKFVIDGMRADAAREIQSAWSRGFWLGVFFAIVTTTTTNLLFNFFVR